MRKKVLIIICLCFLMLVLAGAAVYKKYFSGMLHRSFEESAETVINPYQGVYVQITLGDPEEITEKLERYSDHNLVLLALDLRDTIKDEAVFETRLKNLERALDILREKKLTVIFRAAYDFDGEYEEPDWEILLSHIPQIAEILNSYKDCIAGVQAGMIGPYGEWHSSKYMKNSDYYVKVIECWQNVLEEEIPLSVRRQQFIRQAQKQGADTEKLGIYNDGLFASVDDLGTYQEKGYDRTAELAWSEEKIKVSFNGGEMPQVSEYTEIKNVVKEAKQLHLSYLNRYYDKEVWESWNAQTIEGMNGEDYLKKYLGIRPWIKGIDISRNYHLRKNISIEIDLRNSGFSLLSQDIRAYLFYEWHGEDEVLVKRKAELLMKNKVKGTITGEINNPLWGKEPEMVRIGLMLIRGEDTSEDYYFRLANDAECENGVYWLLEYKNE